MPNVQTRALSLYLLDRMVRKDSEKHDWLPEEWEESEL